MGNYDLIKVNIPNIISGNKYMEIDKYFYIYHHISIVTLVINININKKTEKIFGFINYVNAKWKIIYINKNFFNN